MDGRVLVDLLLEKCNRPRPIRSAGKVLLCWGAGGIRLACILSAENQNGINAALQCSIENQKAP